MKRFHTLFFYSIFFICLTGCGDQGSLAPVSEESWHSLSKYQKTHQVIRGETLYAIAFKYDTDYRRLAVLNHINPPYSLRVGQVLRVQGTIYRQSVLRPRNAAISVSQKKYIPAPRIISAPKNIHYATNGWYWPVSGRVTASFAPWQGKKGINIACNKAESIHAASSGVVAYAGSGIRGYGNLIIVKHNNEYLTAYGNNATNLVSEGQHVRAGQVIARAGLIGKTYWGVHFEVRKKGVPVNPLRYLSRADNKV
jgi:lipoprotein NlpD